MAGEAYPVAGRKWPAWLEELLQLVLTWLLGRLKGGPDGKGN
jgi:hypothetical protein